MRDTLPRPTFWWAFLFVRIPTEGAARMTPKTDTVVSATSYVGAGVSVIAGLTLTEWGVIVGIVTALVTLLINAIYQYRKDRREEKLFNLRVDQIKEGDRDGE